MARPTGPHQGRRLLAQRLLDAVAAYDVILRGAPLAPSRVRRAAIGLAHGWSAAVDDDDPDIFGLGEGLELFGGALEDSLALARAPTPADRRLAMGLPEFVYRLGPLTANRALGDTWAAAARYAPPGVVALAATRLPPPMLHGSPARTRLLALAALARAADEQASAPGDAAERSWRLRELVVAERTVDMLLPGCPLAERAVTVAALARARRLRRALMLVPSALGSAAGGGGTP